MGRTACNNVEWDDNISTNSISNYRLLALDFYEVIVDEGEFYKECARKMIVLLLAIYRGIDSE